jgi:hypothetical protein
MKTTDIVGLIITTGEAPVLLDETMEVSDVSSVKNLDT